MFFNTNNNIITLKDFNGIRIYQEKNPSTNKLFESEEEAAGWLYEYMSKPNVVLYDIKVDFTYDETSAHIKITDTNDILPNTSLIIYIMSDEGYRFNTIVVKKDSVIEFDIRRLEPGHYHLDIEEFVENNICHIMLMNEKYNSFTIEE